MEVKIIYWNHFCQFLKHLKICKTATLTPKRNIVPQSSSSLVQYDYARSSLYPGKDNRFEIIFIRAILVSLAQKEYVNDEWEPLTQPIGVSFMRL